MIATEAVSEAQVAVANEVQAPGREQSVEPIAQKDRDLFQMLKTFVDHLLQNKSRTSGRDESESFFPGDGF